MSGGLVKDKKGRSLLEIKILKMETAEQEDKQGPYLSNGSCMIVHVTHLERPALLPTFKNKRRSHWKICWHRVCISKWLHVIGWCQRVACISLLELPYSNARKPRGLNKENLSLHSWSLKFVTNISAGLISLEDISWLVTGPLVRVSSCGRSLSTSASTYFYQDPISHLRLRLILLKHNHVSKEPLSWGRWDGSAGRDACCQDWWSESIPQNPKCEKTTPGSCPLTSISAYTK